MWDFSTRSFFSVVLNQYIHLFTTRFTPVSQWPRSFLPPRCTNRTVGERIAAISRKEQCRNAKGFGHSPRNLAFSFTPIWVNPGGIRGTLQQLSCIYVWYILQIIPLYIYSWYSQIILIWGQLVTRWTDSFTQAWWWWFQLQAYHHQHGSSAQWNKIMEKKQTPVFPC